MEDLQKNLDEWIEYYNNERIHQGKKCCGRTPLEILLDDGEPIENVPASIKSEGHKILSQKNTDNYWSVIVEKR